MADRFKNLIVMSTVHPYRIKKHGIQIYLGLKIVKGSNLSYFYMYLHYEKHLN